MHAHYSTPTCRMLCCVLLFADAGRVLGAKIMSSSFQPGGDAGNTHKHTCMLVIFLFLSFLSHTQTQRQLPRSMLGRIFHLPPADSTVPHRKRPWPPEEVKPPHPTPTPSITLTLFSFSLCCCWNKCSFTIGVCSAYVWFSYGLLLKSRNSVKTAITHHSLEFCGASVYYITLSGMGHRYMCISLSVKQPQFQKILECWVKWE